MSHSRKKIACEQIPMMSVTEKLRQNAVQSMYKRRCCEKENLNESKERKQSKGRQGNSSSKKLKKKKFLEQQVQKLLQRRYNNEQTKINEIKSQNAFEFEGLRVDLKEMKDVLSKLTSQEKKNMREDKVVEEDDSKEFNHICSSYQRKIDDLRAELEVQKQTNTKLEEAHIQSQLFAKQTKDYCESINKELAELAQKHLKCDQNAQQLQQKRSMIAILQGQKQQLSSRLIVEQIQKNNLQQQLLQITNECSKIKEQYKVLIESLNNQKNQAFLKYQQRQQELKQSAANYLNLQLKYKKQVQLNQKYEQQLEKLKQIIVQTNQEHEKQIEGIKKKITQALKESHKTQKTILQQQIKELNKIIEKLSLESQNYKHQKESILQDLTTEKQRVLELTSKNQLMADLKSKIEIELKKVQAEFNNTKQDLGSTKQKLGSLSSMEKKCEELYMQIKLEKERCATFNIETAKERQTLEARVKELQQLLESEKSESKRLLQDKIKITKQIKQLEEKISLLQINKLQLIQQNETNMNKLAILRAEQEEKYKHWIGEKQKYEMRQLWLEKQKKEIQSEVKNTLEAVKKRNDQIQSTNNTLQGQVNKLKQQKLKIEDSLGKLTSQIENMKSSLSAKQSKITELQQSHSQNESILRVVKEKLVQIESQSKNLNTEWHTKYSTLYVNYQKLQRQNRQSEQYYETELEEWKQKYRVVQKELNQKDDKIQNLSTIRQNLQIKLQDIEEKLHQNQTIRLSLSSELESQLQTTRRNEELLQEQKHMLQNELKLKNKTISELRETVKMVRDESLQIREEVAEYNKLIDLEQLVGTQVRCIQENLNYLKREKDELELAINILKSQNNQLSNKIFSIENNDLQWPQKQARLKDTIVHLQHEIEVVNTEKTKIIQELSSKKEQTKKLSMELEQERSLTSLKLIQSQTTVNTTKMVLDQELQKCQKLAEVLRQKDSIIKEQTQRLKLYQEKRIKVINEVHSIQNQISQIGLKNNQLQEEKAELQEELVKKEQKISLLSQKISILLQNNSALEEQRVALNEQEALLRKEIKQWNEKLKMTNQSNQKTINEVYEICEARKNQASNVLKQKIKQLATQLSNCVNKLNNKNKEIQLLEQKYTNLQSLLQENHELLDQQRKERQRVLMAHNQLLIQMDNLKLVTGSREKENQALARDKTILREKLAEQESKYQILKRKYEALEYQCYNIQKQKENQNISLRVLKEENKNIEKVMADQLNQRKGIIEQLMTEKRMLYAQLNQQR